MTEVRGLRFFTLIIVSVTLVTFACPFSLPWVGRQGNDEALVGKWVYVSPTPTPTPRGGTPTSPAIQIDPQKLLCAVNYPDSVEFFADGTYAAPPRPIVPHNWNGSTYEVLEDGRLRVDLGGKYGVFTFRVERNTLILAAEGCPEVRYQRAE